MDMENMLSISGISYKFQKAANLHIFSLVLYFLIEITYILYI